MSRREAAEARRSFLKPRYLGLVFVLAVILPSILLAALSIRASGREEAFIEKQLQTALLAEVTHAAALAGDEVRTAAEELRASLPAALPPQPEAAFAAWSQAQPLVDVPFLLSPRFALLWPGPDRRLDDRERAFLEDNQDFLGNRVSTQVYKNIALVYQAEILSGSAEGGQTRPKPAGGQGAAAPKDKAPAADAARGAAGPQAPQAAEEKKIAGPAEGLRAEETQAPAADYAQSPAAAPARSAAAPAAGYAQPPLAQLAGAERSPAARTAEAPAPKPQPERSQPVPSEAGEPQPAGPAPSERQPAGPAPSERQPAGPTPSEGQPAGPAPSEPRRGEELASQKALDVFAQSEAVRESVYAQARKKGDVLGTRVVEPSPRLQNAPAESRSQFVTEAERLSGIAARAEYGIIPRFVRERLTFLFYVRLKDGRIAGCSLDAARFRQRIAGVVPAMWSSARILVILDEKGAPLAAPPDSSGRDWRRPFVSREIGETLPRWEAASYLTDPSAVAARARTSGLLIGILVVILFASVSGGGALVLRSLAVETRLARNKATFVTNVSHELKTPLTSIRLFVDMLRQGRQRDPARAGEYLARIEAETERLTRLINSVLDFSALERGTRRYQGARADLGEVTRVVVEGERQRLEAAGFDVRLGAAPAPLGVDADAEALKQVILNLLSNAEKYSPAVKQIEVEVGRDGESCAVRVRDRGVGVPERLREKIFQEFFRVDDSLTARVKGTGLGLTIARRIARDHGGDVTCAAREGGGSEFTLRLPARGKEGG